MTKQIWNSGPPPHIGWWQASNDRTENVWRFWFGKHWSVPAWDDLKPEHIGRDLARDTNGAIEWTGYWPKNARVPRLDPRGGHWTFNNGERPVELPPFTDYVSRAGTSNMRCSRSDMMTVRWALVELGGDIIAWRPSP